MKSSAVANVAETAKRIFRPAKKHKTYIPILVHIWHEDGVWNVSAFDLPIVVFDEDLDQARRYFTEAMCSHFMTLTDLGKMEKTATQLIKKAKERGFYEDRIKSRQLVERVDYSPDDAQCLCAAGG